MNLKDIVSHSLLRRLAGVGGLKLVSVLSKAGLAIFLARRLGPEHFRVTTAVDTLVSHFDSLAKYHAAYFKKPPLIFDLSELSLQSGQLVIPAFAMPLESCLIAMLGHQVSTTSKLPRADT
jgi:hypothetical protein